VARPVPPVMPGVLAPIFGLISGALFVALVIAIVSLVNTGAVFGWRLPPGVPVPVGVLALLLAYGLVTGPLHSAQHASYGGPYQAQAATWNALVWLTVVGALLWLASHHMPEIRQFARNLPALWASVKAAFKG
jgi:hypothetical protein